MKKLFHKLLLFRRKPNKKGIFPDRRGIFFLFSLPKRPYPSGFPKIIQDKQQPEKSTKKKTANFFPRVPKKNVTKGLSTENKPENPAVQPTAAFGESA